MVATSAGNGASDIAPLTRTLIMDEVNGDWVQAQIPKDYKNRVNTLLQMRVGRF